MQLTEEEKEILSGRRGEALEKAMEIVTALGEIYGADRLVPIRSAQIAGVSYKNIGDAGLELIEDFAKGGARVQVMSTLNPAGMDLKFWKDMGVPPKFAAKQKRIIDAYGKMGILTTCTCTPYDISNIALKGDHVAWSESSAVVFVNSVFGARTNREGGPSSLACALVGKTANYGMHLDENRVGKLLVKVKVPLGSGTDYSVMGHYIGKIAGSRIPTFDGPRPDNIYKLKNLSAGLAASGSVNMFHMVDVTPEPEHYVVRHEETIEFGEKELKAGYDALNSDVGVPDIVAIGCPHASIRGIGKIAEYLEGKKVKTKFWIFTSAAVKQIADRQGYTKAIEDAGARVFTDTCFVVAPVEEMGIKTLLTNSAKMAHYAPSWCGVRAGLAPLKEIVGRVT